MRQPIPFGKYLLLDRVSVGGMAEVFKAKSYGVEGFEKVIAIKRILPSMGEDRDFIKMFIDEAKIAGQLSHANICQIFELGRIDGAHFIAMEYIWGKDLLQLQNRFKKLNQIMPVSMACFAISKVCEGLDYAHRKKDALGRPLQIVHRDCSPQNVLISFEGEVKVIDFGIAKAASRSSRTMAGVLKGKFGYMSPEQVRGLPLDRRSDIFALGTMLYESLTGERLFMGESDFSTLERVRNVDIQPIRNLNRNIPPEVEAIVMKALTKDPDDRYQWCSEMRADLQQYLMAQPEVFTAKSLAGWLRTGFDAELAHERRLMEGYKQLGRDGLIQGMPAAEAKLDVEQYLGAAGTSDDPTMLGGPSFEDMEADLALSDEPLPARRAAGRQRTNSEFGDEAPTELFGEVGGNDEDRPTYDRIEPLVASPSGGASGVEVADLNVEVPILGVHAAAQAAEAARAVSIAQAATISPSSGMMAPDISSLGMPHAIPSFTPPGMYGTDRSYFGSTSNVTPLPLPAAVSDLDRLRANRRRRPSVAKDVGIGIAIAAVVLGMFAGGKYLFFGDAPGTKEARGGTIAVALPGNEISAEVWIDDEKVGVVEGDEPLTLEERPAGTYRVKVTRPGVQDCEKKIEVESGKPSIVTCTFVKEPETGLLVIEGLAADHTVFFDGQQISDEAAREPLKLTPGQEHSIVIKQGDEIIKELNPTGVAGRELRRVIVETSRADTPAPSVVVADVTPPRAPAPDKPRESSSASTDAPTRTERPIRPRTVDVAKRAPPDKPTDEAGTEVDDKYGYLIANTTPWARVWIDGKDTGRSTPIARRSKIKLEPGKHKVVFMVGNQKFPYSVVVTAGEISKLVKDLEVKE